MGVLLALGACSETVVRPADVMVVRITPEEAQLGVGGSMSLTAEAFDGEDQPLLGYRVDWSSDDASVATVDDQGRVSATGVGTTTIRATAGSAEGTASLVVQESPVPLIGVAPASVAFSMDENSDAPQDVTVAVRNTGEGAISGLDLATSYAGAATGWLTAALSSRSTPADLSLRAERGSLGPGSYRATVRVSSPDAGNSPVTVAVVLEVAEATTGGGSAPAAPSGLSASTTSASTIELSWSDNSDTETEFRIERQAPGESSFHQVASVSENVTTYVDSSVQPDGRYEYRVRACSEAGCSDPSGAEAAYTPPTAPGETSATALSESEIRVEWSDLSITETRFEVQRRETGGSFEARATVETATFEDTGLEPGTTYTYRVRACNPGGCSSFSPEGSATTEVPAPSTPAGVTVAYESGGMAVRWSAAEWAAEYLIQRSIDGGEFTELARTGGDVTLYEDRSIQADRRYDYRIIACNPTDCSDPSSSDGAVTPPSVPADLEAQAAKRGRVQLNWVDTSQLETSFRIERAVASNDESDFQLLVEGLPPNKTSYVDEDVAEETEYYYRVRACNDSGCSAPSNTVSIEIDD